MKLYITSNKKNGYNLSLTLCLCVRVCMLANLSGKKLREVLKMVYGKVKVAYNRDQCGQFHQHFMCAFAPKFFRQKKFKPKM